MKTKLLTSIIIAGGIFILSANKPTKTIRVIESDSKENFEKLLNQYSAWGFTIVSTNLSNSGQYGQYYNYHATLIK